MKMLRTWLSTVFGLRKHSSPIRWLECPSAISVRTSRSRGESSSSGPASRATQQAADDRGIDDALAAREPAQRVAQGARVADPHFEEVAAAGRVPLEQGGRV